MKSKRIDTDTRTNLARAVHQLKQQHGPRITAHLLYHQARTLTLEADRQAMAKCAINVAIGGKADMPFCSAYVRL